MSRRRAVIHRDLKLSNVFVAIRDDRPEPKIIDFGIAKATAQRLPSGRVTHLSRSLTGCSPATPSRGNAS